MGNFRIELNAVGGHGCQREVKAGEIVTGCGHAQCPDCVAREFVKQMKATGSAVDSATLTHWPGSTSEVKDDLLTGIRHGSF